MQKTLPLIAILLLQAFILKAQSLIYNENFSGTVSNFSIANATWGISAADPNTNAGASGGNYATTIVDKTSTAVSLTNLRTVDYHSILVSFSASRAKNTSGITLEYSLDGVNFIAITGFTDVTENTGWNKINGGTPIALPAATANATSLTLRCSITLGKNQAYAIDDVQIWGTPNEGLSAMSYANRPNNEDPFVVSSPTASSPYTTDGVSIRYSKATSTGVNLTTAVLSDATFQSPTRSLTLIQNGATTTKSTVVTTTFSKAVSDLTFTLLDVDRSAGQFRDAIKVEGYKNNTLVPLQKSNVITTTLNEFVSSSNTIQAVATGGGAASNTTDGNVVVSFASAVDKVVITYSNLDAGAGNQGVGITSMAWRTAPTPLPVTFTAFNGKLQNNQAELRWVTASEKNNDKFIVEKSLDGRKFESIGTVKGKGTTATASSYSFNDKQPATGLNYYRLKQIDFDGKFEYSKIITVKNDKNTEATLSVYPVPATTEINVTLTEISGMETLRIYNLAGKIVNEVNLKGNNQLQLTIPVNALPAGYYIVQVSGPQNTLSRKIAKQ